jgi:hypothetical protein
LTLLNFTLVMPSTRFIPFKVLFDIVSAVLVRHGFCPSQYSTNHVRYITACLNRIFFKIKSIFIEIN